MAFLKSLFQNENESFTDDLWFTDYGPLGVSGFNSDGKEVGCEFVLFLLYFFPRKFSILAV